MEKFDCLPPPKLLCPFPFSTVYVGFSVVCVWDPQIVVISLVSISLIHWISSFHKKENPLIFNSVYLKLHPFC